MQDGGGGGNRIGDLRNNKGLQNHDTCSTLPEQKQTQINTQLEPTSPSKDKTTIDSVQNQHKNEHQECAICVPSDSLPNDLPDAVILGLQNWHRLPTYIRTAVEALLKDCMEKDRTT